MNKIILLLFMILCVSCNKENDIESIFITNKNEYWEFHNYCYDSNTYFQLKENGSFDAYLISDAGFDIFNNDGDLKSGPRSWSIKNDSIFVLNKGIYKIEKVTNKEILLSYCNYELKSKKCFIKLSKWVNTSKGPKLLDELDTIEK